MWRLQTEVSYSQDLKETKDYKSWGGAMERIVKDETRRFPLYFIFWSWTWYDMASPIKEVVCQNRKLIQTLGRQADINRIWKNYLHFPLHSTTKLNILVLVGVCWSLLMITFKGIIDIILFIIEMVMIIQYGSVRKYL